MCYLDWNCIILMLTSKSDKWWGSHDQVTMVTEESRCLVETNLQNFVLPIVNVWNTNRHDFGGGRTVCLCIQYYSVESNLQTIVLKITFPIEGCTSLKEISATYFVFYEDKTWLIHLCAMLIFWPCHLSIFCLIIVNISLKNNFSNNLFAVQTVISVIVQSATDENDIRITSLLLQISIKHSLQIFGLIASPMLVYNWSQLVSRLV